MFELDGSSPLLMAAQLSHAEVNEQDAVADSARLPVGFGGADSPDGTASGVPSATGTPRFGVPSAFQVNFWARVVRLMSQPWLVEELAW